MHTLKSLLGYFNRLTLTLIITTNPTRLWFDYLSKFLKNKKEYKYICNTLSYTPATHHLEMISAVHLLLHIYLNVKKNNQWFFTTTIIILQSSHFLSSFTVIVFCHLHPLSCVSANILKPSLNNKQYLLINSHTTVTQKQE